MTNRSGSGDVVIDAIFKLPDDTIVSLFRRLPEKGAHWPLDQRVLWLQAMESVLHMVYGPVETIDVSGLLPVQREAAGKLVDGLAEENARRAKSSAEPTDEALAGKSDVASGSREARTTEASDDSRVGGERSSSAETYVPTSYVPPLPKNAGGAPSKSNRPADMPTNLAAAVEAIQALGNRAAAPQIRDWIKSKYWPEIPMHWTSVLWGFANEGKLARDGINFILPREDAAPKPAKSTPVDPDKQGFPPKREVTPAVPAVRKPTLPAPKTAAPLQAFTFKHGDKSAMLSTTQQLLVANRLFQVKGQHVAEAFLAEKAFGSNTERYREQVKALALGLNGPLFNVGLKVTYYPGHGLMMREIEG